MKVKKRGHFGGRRRQEIVERIFMTQSAKTAFWEEIKRDRNCGKSTRDSIVALDKALKCVEKSCKG